MLCDCHWGMSRSAIDLLMGIVSCYPEALTASLPPGHQGQVTLQHDRFGTSPDPGNECFVSFPKQPSSCLQNKRNAHRLYLQALAGPGKGPPAISPGPSGLTALPRPRSAELFANVRPPSHSEVSDPPQLLAPVLRVQPAASPRP